MRTYTISASVGEGIDGAKVAAGWARVSPFIGGNVVEGYGIWDGAVEPSVTITSECIGVDQAAWLAHRALNEAGYPWARDCRWLHILEVGRGRTYYYDRAERTMTVGESDGS